MMKNLSLLAAILLTGCNTTTKMPTEVEIPVPVKIKHFDVPAKPYLPIADLKSTDSPSVVIRKYVATVKVMSDYTNELEDIIDAIQK